MRRSGKRRLKQGRRERHTHTHLNEKKTRWREDGGKTESGRWMALQRS